MSQFELPDPGLLPDSPFYFLEIISEEIGNFFTFGDIKKAERYAALSAERMAEAENLVENWKISWDNLEVKPRALEVNRARRLINSLKPIVTDLEVAKTELATKVASEIGIEYCEANQAALLGAGAILSIDKFSPTTPNPDKTIIFTSISNTLRESGQMELLMFSCPEIKAFWLNTDEPDSFINTEAKVNTATVDPKPINQLSRILGALDISSRLNIVVGELDEESYIFPVLGNFGVDVQRLTERRSEYLQSFKSLIAKTYPGTNLQILSWSEIANSGLIVLDKLPSLSFIVDESRRMKDFFKPGGYYDGLPEPNPQQLIQMARLKMQTYTRQGNTLKKLFPNAIGIQNESPALLRTLMINAGLKAEAQETIPYIYPFNERRNIY